jgi:N,N'-diacetyllegionaminate synthase
LATLDNYMNMRPASIALNNRLIGFGEPCFIIAEVGQAHDGSLGMAHSYIDLAADIGVDAIKFQTHIASSESTLNEEFRVKFSLQDSSRFAYWRRMEFSPEQWAGLAEHAGKRNLIFLSSAFSLQAVDLLKNIGMAAWKIGSGELSNVSLLHAICSTGQPILLSTGMSDYASIEKAVSFIKSYGVDYCLFQCTSNYPVALSNVGLNVMTDLMQKFGCPVGLSDHSGLIYPALAAMALGASLVEAHIVFDRRMFGPDASSSLVPDEFLCLTKARDAFHKMKSSPVNKDSLAYNLSEMRSLFGRSVSLVSDMSRGTIISADMLTLKKPGNGISEEHMASLVGRRLKRDVVSEYLLTWDDLDD